MSIFDLPSGVLNKVLECASTSETSAYSTCALVNKALNERVKATYHYGWGQLRKHWETLPEFHVLKSCFAEVDKNDDKSAHWKLKELSRKTQISFLTLFGTSEYCALMQEHDTALCTIWKKKLRDLFINKRSLNTIVPAANASANNIRKFLEEKKEILETIMELDLSYLSLKTLPPEILLLCKNLQELRLYYDEFRELVIPKECVNLRALYLTNNQLKELVIPKECVNLRKLVVNNNQLERLVIPKECVKLEGLYLICNQLKELIIPKECVHLKELNLGYNYLKELVIPKECVNLAGLRLNNNQLKEFVIPKECVNLTRLELSNNHLEVFVIPKECVNLQTLELSNNHLEVFVIPKECVGLDWLYLTNNQLKEFVLPKECVNLQTLELNNNHLEGLVIPKECVNLRSLELNNNQLKELAIPEECVKLIVLGLRGNIFLLVSGTLTLTDTLIGLYSESKCESKSPLGCLFKEISNKETKKELMTIPKQQLIQLFSVLTEAQKNRIYHNIWEGAGRPIGDPQWGEHHCFDDIVLFSTAVQKSIFDTFNELTQEERSKVEGEVYHLAVAHSGKVTLQMQKDPFWGKNHALDDLVLLADALFNVKEGRL